MTNKILSIVVLGTLSIGFSGCVGGLHSTPLTFYKTIKIQGVLENTQSNENHGTFTFRPTFDKLTGSFKNYILKNNNKGIYTNNFQSYIRETTGTFYAMYVVGAIENQIFFVGGVSTGLLSFEKSLQVYNVDTKTIKRLVSENSIIQFYKNGNERAIKVTNEDNTNTKYISMNNLKEYSTLSDSFRTVKIKGYYNLARGGLGESFYDKMTVGQLYSKFNIYALYHKMPILFQ